VRRYGIIVALHAMFFAPANAQGVGDLSHLPQYVLDGCKNEIASTVRESVARCVSAHGFSLRAQPRAAAKKCRVESVESINAWRWEEADRELDGIPLKIHHQTSFTVTPSDSKPLLVEGTTRVSLQSIRYAIQKKIAENLPESTCEARRSSFSWVNERRAGQATVGANSKIDVRTCCKDCWACPTTSHPLRKCDIYTDLGSVSARVRVHLVPSVLNRETVRIQVDAPPVEIDDNTTQLARDLLHNLNNIRSVAEPIARIFGAEIGDPREKMSELINEVNTELKRVSELSMKETLTDAALKSEFSFEVTRAEFEEGGDGNQLVLRIVSRALVPDVVGCRLVEELRKYNKIQVGR
jgi:hypothetical protein